MPYRIVLYPNNEVSAHWRQTRPVSHPKDDDDDDGLAVASTLDIRGKLEQNCSEALAATVKADKPGYGGVPKPTEFGLRARRRMRRLAGVFDHLEGQSIFITLTLPGSTDESYRVLSCYSSSVVHRYKVWLCQQSVRFENGPLHYLYCWEWQKRGALHLHMLLNCQRKALYDSLKATYHDRWFKLLKSLSKSSGVDVFSRHCGGTHKNTPEVWQSDCQDCTGFMGAYLGKYMSKGSSDDQSNQACGYYPVRWWGASQGLRELYKDFVYSVNSRGDYNEFLEDWLNVNKSCAAGLVREHSYPLQHCVGLGRVAYISPDDYNSVVDCIEAASARNMEIDSEVKSSKFANNGHYQRVKNMVGTRDYSVYEKLDELDKSTWGAFVRGELCSASRIRRLSRRILALTE